MTCGNVLVRLTSSVTRTTWTETSKRRRRRSARSGPSILQSTVEPVGVGRALLACELSTKVASSATLLLLPDPKLPWEAPNKARAEIDFDSQRLTSFLRSASQVFTSIETSKNPKVGGAFSNSGGGGWGFCGSR